MPVLNGEKILIVEDEIDIVDVMKYHLQSAGYDVTAISNGQNALTEIQNNHFDLFILDRMLPGTNGIEICKFIRNFNQTKDHPILMVTALTRSENIIEGLDAGADDYITKPFDLNVLMARVKALLRRSQILISEGKTEPLVNSISEIGPIKVDTDQCEVWVYEEPIQLTLSEYKLLCLLLQSSRKVLSRKDLVKNIQGDEIHVTERTIDTHIFGLRKKLGDASKMIETIRGIGYRVTDNYV
ncbi:MAG: response regulator transcription factor [Halobacteriovoraceae bacterium]|nr:response regulator transcription factor [Halobacteriovoraceae bacterium]